MKLYVWHDVLTDYTSGIMFALANSVDEARELICPQWNVAETACHRPGANQERPLGAQEGVHNGHGYYVGTMHHDLRAEPAVYDAPVGFIVWGGS